MESFSLEETERPYMLDTDLGHPDAIAETAAPVSTVPVNPDFSSSWKYEAYLEGNGSAIGSIQSLRDRLLWKYTSVLIAQPFEVAKVVLQTRTADEPAEEARAGVGAGAGAAAEKRRSINAESLYEYPDSDSDDEPAYFSSNVAHTAYSSSSRRRGNQSRRHDAAGSPTRQRNAPAHQLVITNPDSIVEAIAQHWNKEGGRAVWKGTNMTFLYTILHSLIENWSRGALAALFGVPDLVAEEDMLDAFTRTTHPMVALGVTAGAAVVAGLILAPLDLVRTKLLITSAKDRHRGVMENLLSLPSHICPSMLVLPTILHSLVQPMLTISLPLTLQSKFKMDWKLSPMTFSVTKFCAASAALFIKLPLETVLRRGQVAVLSSEPYAGPEPLQTTITPCAYRGVLGTLFEGKGLMRGWKVGFIGLVGLWTAGVISTGGEQDDIF